MQLQYSVASTVDIPLIFDQCCTLIEKYEDISTLDYNKVKGWIYRKIEANIRQYTCVYYDNQKAAYYRCYQNGDRMELDDLYVLPGFRGKGIGSLILRKCRTESALPIFLYVFTRNVRAISLYQRNGYVVTEQVSPTRCIMVCRT